jgi:hypothetical protein
MRKKMILIVTTCLIAFFTVTNLGFSSKNKISVTGVWKIVEVQTVKADGAVTATFPSESQVIFLKDYYSFCWTSHTSQSRSWQMPDSVKLARLNQTIINAGTYILDDATLTTKASFAMNPMFVGGDATFSCSFKGDTLILSGKSVFSSEHIANPVYAAGSHIVNKLVRITN